MRLNEIASMAKARIVHSGKDQFVVLPKEIRLKSDTVEIFRRGEDTILREVPPSRELRDLINERRREPGPGVSLANLMAEAKRELAASRPERARGRAKKT